MLESDSKTSFDISLTSYPFKLNEPVIVTLPLKYCLSVVSLPNIFEPDKYVVPPVWVSAVNES